MYTVVARDVVLGSRCIVEDGNTVEGDGFGVDPAPYGVEVRGTGCGGSISGTLLSEATASRREALVTTGEATMWNVCATH